MTVPIPSSENPSFDPVAEGVSIGPLGNGTLFFKQEITMRRWMTVGLMALAFAAGTQFSGIMTASFAQDDAGVDKPSAETTKKIVAANDAIRAAMEGLKQEQRYNPITKTVNPYAVLVGGLDSMADLESGRGVDPYTFAALYAGDAIETVAAQLTKDAEGRVLYKNRLVRMYPVSRFKKLEGQRLQLSGSNVTPAEEQ